MRLTSGSPAELQQQEIVHASAEHQPARVAVSREVPSEAGDGEYRFLHGRCFGIGRLATERRTSSCGLVNASEAGRFGAWRPR
ncbi:MAG: hypothetical protein ABIY55_20430 [Kofleriaceae bacterium]